MMKKLITLFFLQIIVFPIWAQDGFQFDNEFNKTKISIPFKFINNLIFIPIKVNGVELNFMLDSGVEETVLFSLEEKKEISFSNVEKVALRGLGSQEAVEGLKSTNNLLEINGMKSEDHLLYIILDQNFNLSSHIGIPVNGIIGYRFFKNNLVEINYERKRIIIYKENKKNRKRIEKKFETIPITIEKFKPYVIANVVVDQKNISAKLLVDIGNSDAVWLFPNQSEEIKIPVKNFDDFLGKGFSGNVEGKRARISKFSLSKFEFDNPIVAFPDSNSIKNVKMVSGRLGSIGADALKKFSVVFDYANSKIYLKKNKEYHSPFNYNKSGIEIQHHGLQWVQETIRLETVPLLGNRFDSDGNKITNDFKYKFQMKPIYEIANLRKNSPAVNCGLQKGDIIVTINKIPAYRYSLQEINSLFKSEDEKWITLEIEREGRILKFTFQLLDVL